MRKKLFKLCFKVVSKEAVEFKGKNHFTIITAIFGSIMLAERLIDNPLLCLIFVSRTELVTPMTSVVPARPDRLSKQSMRSRRSII